MMKTVCFLFLVVISVAYSKPQDEGKVELELKNGDGGLTANIHAGESWKSDDGRTVVEGEWNHWRNLDTGHHQTNLGLSGSHDVYTSDDGRTKGTVFGSVGTQWDSWTGDTTGFEYGGRIEHTWDK